MFKDYYKRLGIGRNATKQEIKKAYRKLALQYHPDKNKSPDAHETFITINEAYLILYDEEAKAKYDKEYDYFISNESRYYEKKNYTNDTTSSKKSSDFDDFDLNKWAKNARKQGDEFAKMKFSEFSKIVFGYIKETGIELGNTLARFYGVVFIIGGIIGIASSTKNNSSSIILLSIVSLILGIILFRFSIQKKKPQ